MADALKFTEDHLWLRVEGNRAQLGISEYGQAELGEVIAVELPDVGDEVEKGEPFGELESVRTVSELLSPLTGTVTAINPELEDHPAIASTSAALSTCPLPMRTGRVVTESPRGGKPAPGAFQRRTLCYSPAHGSGNDILRACDPTLCLGEQFQKIFPKRRSSLDSLPRPLLYSASVDAGLWGFSPGRWGGKRTLPTSNRR